MNKTNNLIHALFWILLIMFVIAMGAFRWGRAMDIHSSWVSNCILANADFRPPQGIRSYCEEQYWAQGR
jgi:hypothetical protein